MTRPKPEVELTLEDFKYALQNMETFIDVSADDLMQLTELAHAHAQQRVAGHELIRDIMTAEVMTVAPDTPLRDAAQMLIDHRISGLPVADQDGHLVGIVTEADFLRTLGIPCRHPSHSLWQTLENMFSEPSVSELLPKCVADIMSERVVTIQAHESIHDAIASMKNNHVKRLVVIDEERKVCGIVTRSNMVEVLLQKVL